MRSVVLILCASLAGCSTQIRARKVSPNDQHTPGIRASLPMPVLTVTPGPDGSVTDAWTYMPDAANTYAVEAQSFLASHKLQVDVEKGLLKKLIYNPDSSAVAKSAVPQFGTAAQQILNTKLEERNAERAAREAEATQRETQLKTLKDAVVQAEKDLAQERAKLEAQIKYGEPESTLRATRIRIAELEAALQFAQERLGKFESGLLAKRSSGGTALSSGDWRDRFPRVHGPVSYRIEESHYPDGRTRSVRLVPLRGPDDVPQKAWLTSKVPPKRGEPPAPSPGPPPDFRLSPGPGERIVVPVGLRQALLNLEAATARREALAKAPKVSLAILSQAIIEEADLKTAYGRKLQDTTFAVTSNLDMKELDAASTSVEDHPLKDKPNGKALADALERSGTIVLVGPRRIEFRLPPRIGKGAAAFDLPDGPYKVALVIDYDGGKESPLVEFEVDRK